MVSVERTIRNKRIYFNYCCLTLPTLLLLAIQIQQQQHHLTYEIIPTVYAIEVDDLVHQALVSIKEADSVGVDTSHLVTKLNDALNIIRDVERDDGSESCTDRDECIATAAGMLNSIVDEAKRLHRQKVKEDADRFYINMLVYAPMGALISSITLVLLYTNLKGYMHTKLMEMDVKEVKEE